MIKIALKHYIYENCISIFFDFINRNFHTPKLKKITASMFREGDSYNYIQILIDGISYTLYDCNIKSVCFNKIVITYAREVEYDKAGNIKSLREKSSSLCSGLFYDDIVEISETYLLG